MSESWEDVLDMEHCATPSKAANRAMEMEAPEQRAPTTPCRGRRLQKLSSAVAASQAEFAISKFMGTVTSSSNQPLFLSFKRETVNSKSSEPQSKLTVSKIPARVIASSSGTTTSPSSWARAPRGGGVANKAKSKTRADLFHMLTAAYEERRMKVTPRRSLQQQSWRATVDVRLLTRSFRDGRIYLSAIRASASLDFHD